MRLRAKKNCAENFLVSLVGDEISEKKTTNLAKIRGYILTSDLISKTKNSNETC